MKKTFLAIMLLSVLSLQAQTSRIMIGLGGGLATSCAKGSVENNCGSMGTFNFGYSIMGNVGSDSVQLGLRTGLNASYLKYGDEIRLDERFTNVDYYGHQMDYTITGSRVSFVQQQINVELPVMFAIRAKGVNFNIGAKFMLPVMKRYTQSIENPQISVFYPEYGVTVTNDITTGLVPDAQKNMSGTVTMPTMFIGLSAELGYTWQLRGSRNSLGFDVFFDYVPWGIGGGSADTGHSLVEVSPMVNDREQPMAEVKVNPLNCCNGYKHQFMTFGAKLVYTFDVEHNK